MLFRFVFCTLYNYHVSSSIPENKEFHTATVESDSPFLFCILSQPDNKVRVRNYLQNKTDCCYLILQPLSCPPAMRFVTTQRQNTTYRYLVRGDSEGFVLVWHIPDFTTEQLQIQQKPKASLPMNEKATYVTSLTAAWANMKPGPVGILDQIEKSDPNCM